MRTHSLRSASLQWGIAARIQWPAVLPLAAVSVLRLGPCVLAALGALLLGSCDWCHGGVRIALALCLAGGSATVTLLHGWERCPDTMARSAARAVIGALVATAPLLGGM